MLHIWVGKYERYDAVHKPDTYFDINFDYKLTGTDFAKRLIHDCSQESEVIAPGYFKHPTRGYYSFNNLPSSIKTIFLAKYNPEVVPDLLYCGDNCLPYLAEIANEQEVTVCSKRHVNFFYPILERGEFKGGIHAMNTDEIINDPFEWLIYLEDHKRDVIENEEGSVNPFDWSYGVNELSGTKNPEIFLYTKNEIFKIRLKTKYTILKGEVGSGKSYIMDVLRRGISKSDITASAVTNVRTEYVYSTSMDFVYEYRKGIYFLDGDVLRDNKDFVERSLKSVNSFVLVGDGYIDGIPKEQQTICELGKDTDIIEIIRR